jgi:hypothetical protein
MGRRRSNRRKHKRGISTPLIAAMMIFFIIGTSASISAFEWLRDLCLSRIYIKGVTIKGNQRISSENILNASRLRVGVDTVCSIVPHLVEKYIRAESRYLKQVSVEHSVIHESEAGLCGWVTIEIAEREPLAIVEFGEDSDFYIIIDAQGFILEEIQSGSRPTCLSPDESLPTIAGIDRKALDNRTQDDSDLGNSFTDPALELALDVLVTARSVIPDMLKEISSVDARDSDNIIVLLQNKGGRKERRIGSKELRSGDAVSATPGQDRAVIRLASDLIEEGLSNILPVITKRREENRGMKYIDARFPGTVYCGEEIHYERRWKSG